MRRNYISPEYSNQKVYGTYNKLEESNFFGSKMLDVEDMINISNLDIIWYQKLNNEQLDIDVESTLNSYIYSSAIDMYNNHTLEIDDTQKNSQLISNTRWILKISIKSILSNYLFATLKKSRTFEGVKNEFTKENDIDIFIKNYIKYNILDRYKMSKIDMYIKYKDLRNQTLLKYKNTWTPNIEKNNLFTRFQAETEFDQSSIKIIFNQDQPSSQYSFEYYFNINFERI
jgi:hypothetical protein